MTEPEDLVGDAPLVLIGGFAGLLVGAGLGSGCSLLLLNSVLSGASMIVVLHTMFAMMLMGAWTAPSLLSSNEHRPPAEQEQPGT